MKIIPIYLLITLFITLMVMFLIAPEPKIIVKYPNLHDDMSLLYEDDEGVCYRYRLVKNN